MHHSYHFRQTDGGKRSAYRGSEVNEKKGSERDEYQMYRQGGIDKDV